MIKDWRVWCLCCKISWLIEVLILVWVWKAYIYLSHQGESSWRFDVNESMTYDRRTGSYQGDAFIEYSSCSLLSKGCSHGWFGGTEGLILLMTLDILPLLEFVRMMRKGQTALLYLELSHTLSRLSETMVLSNQPIELIASLPSIFLTLLEILKWPNVEVLIYIGDACTLWPLLLTAYCIS